MARYVKVSEARAQLTKLMALAENELDWVILTRHGKPVASLVSHAQMMRIFDDENIDLFGPINPETGRQMGAAWVKRTGWVRGEGIRSPASKHVENGAAIGKRKGIRARLRKLFN